MKVRYRGYIWFDLILFSLLTIGPLIVLFTSEITRSLLIKVIICVLVMGNFTIHCFKLILGAYISYDDKYLYINYLDLRWYGKNGKLSDPFYRNRTFNKNGHTIKVIKKKVLIKNINGYIFNDEGDIVIKTNNNDIIIPMKQFNKNKTINLLNSL